jgi:hypothetical protein
LATGSVGTVLVDVGIDVNVTGVQGVGQVGSVLVWSIVNDSQTVNWQNVNDAQANVWTRVAA